MTAPRWLRLTSQTFSNNSTTILSGIAVAGVAATAILAVRATPKALVHRSVILDEKWAEAGTMLKDQDEATAGLTHTETVKECWKFYIPAAISGAATIACIIGANKIGLRRNAALLGAYTLADTAFREYKDEVIKQIGETKARKVHDEVAKRQIDEHPVTDTQVIITGGGDQLCYESLTGRYFKSDVERLRRSENEFNRNILAGSMYGSLNEFFDYIGLGSTTLGDELGFNVDNPLQLVFTSHLAENGIPCLAIGYGLLPRKDYAKL